MFKKKNAAETNLQELIDTAQTQLFACDVDSPEYDKIFTKLEGLYKLHSHQKATSRISPDVAATILANLFGIIVILNHERLHVVTSKALSFVMKTKI